MRESSSATSPSEAISNSSARLCHQNSFRVLLPPTPALPPGRRRGAPWKKQLRAAGSAAHLNLCVRKRPMCPLDSLHSSASAYRTSGFPGEASDARRQATRLHSTRRTARRERLRTSAQTRTASEESKQICTRLQKFSKGSNDPGTCVDQVSAQVQHQKRATVKVNLTRCWDNPVNNPTVRKSGYPQVIVHCVFFRITATQKLQNATSVTLH